MVSINTLKFRKAYIDIENYLFSNNYRIIVLLGMRKSGKTTILRQLAAHNNGHYIDFRNEKDGAAAYSAALQGEKDLLLFDEIGHLAAFDVYMEMLESEAGCCDKSIVITSSSYTAMRQLVTEKLGGGRAKAVALHPLGFEEYLYFSGRISEYGADYIPTAADVEDFYRLKGVPAGMDFVLDRDFLIGTFSDELTVLENMQYAQRGIFLNETQYTSVLDILSYTLNRQFRLNVFNDARVGVQEYGGAVAHSLDLSTALITYSNEVTKKMTSVEIATVVAALYMKGFLFLDLVTGNFDKPSPERAVTDLLAVKTDSDLRAVLTRYIFSFISPLLYTRLMVDIEDIVGKFVANPSLYGRLYELTIKTESVCRHGFRLFPCSYFYKHDITGKEIDLYDHPLLLEATVETKTNENGHLAFIVDSVLERQPLIRVLTDVPDVNMKMSNYWRLGYPLALLKLSNGTIFDLDPSP